MNIDFLLHLPEKLWKFALDNPEIAIFITGAVFACLTWLWRNYSEPVREWIHRIVDPHPKSPRFFINVGEKQGHMLWEDCVRYGCISAGGGYRWKNAIQRLTVGSKVYAYVAGSGYAGYGEVVERAVPIKDFTVGANKKPLLEMDLATNGLAHNKDDLELSEYVAGIKWLKTFERERARRISTHVYRGTVCKLSQKTVKLLRKEFKA